MIFYLDTQKMEWDQDVPDHRYYKPEPSYQNIQNDQSLTELNQPSDYQIYYSVLLEFRRDHKSLNIWPWQQTVKAP